MPVPPEATAVSEEAVGYVMVDDAVIETGLGQTDKVGDCFRGFVFKQFKDHGAFAFDLHFNTWKISRFVFLAEFQFAIEIGFKGVEMSEDCFLFFVVLRNLGGVLGSERDRTIKFVVEDFHPNQLFSQRLVFWI